MRLLVVLVLLSVSSALTFSVDAHKEECFYEIAQTGEQLSVFFQVSSGGFMDIDLKITGPDKGLIHAIDREREYKHNFTAKMDGPHMFCFSNKMSTLTPKIVSFSVVKGSVKPLSKTEHLSPIEDSVAQLRAGLSKVQEEQYSMRARERAHRNTSESTNARVLWWSFFEAVLLVAMSLWQVYYLRRTLVRANRG